MNAYLVWGCVCIAVLGVGCSTTVAPICGPNDHATRYSVEQIDAMSDEQVKDNLARNNELERRGCAISN